MSKVFEKFSQELTMELWELKIKLKLAEEKIEEQTEKIYKITDSSIMLEAENVFLKHQLKELSTPKSVRQPKAMSSTPSKPCQDEDARSRSDSSEKWAVVEKSARRLKYSEVAGAGDSLSNSEGFVKSVAIQVNNLNSTTSVKSLRAYFSKFGEIIDISTSQPGSAYVQFQKFYDDNPLASLNHVIDGRHVDLQAAKSYKSSQTLRVNLPPDGISESRLHSYFSKYGTVNRVIRPDFESNFAFVSFDSPQSVDKAFTDDHVINSVRIQIQRTRDFYVNERLPGKKQIKTKTLLVSADVSIMKKLTSHDLEDHFSPYGKVFGVRKPTINSETTHFAFVQFTTSVAVEKATEEKYHTIKGHQVNVSKSKTSTN